MGVGLLVEAQDPPSLPGTNQPCRRRQIVATTHPLAIPIRLPDALQAEALGLLDVSRLATSELLVELWPQLDRFATERTGPAWKQVEQYAVKRSGHGSRQERCDTRAGGAHPAVPSQSQAGFPLNRRDREAGSFAPC